MAIDPDAFDDELTPAQLAALDAMDGGFDPADLDPDDLDVDPPPEWLAMSPEDRLAPPRQTVPEVLDAGFTHREGGGGRGFAAGGMLDRMAPGGRLTMYTDRVWAEGLGRLSDDELIGLMAAARRGASRQAAAELAAIGELAVRRSGPGGVPGAHVADEVAAALTLTGRAAAGRVAMAEGLARLPGVGRALAAGRIDLPRAGVFAGQLTALEFIAANAIAAVTLPDAAGVTTGQLRAALQREILACDPAAAIRRRKEAEKDARVESWTEAAGTGALAGRDLSPVDVLAADQTLTADARWLKTHGAEGRIGQLRARAFTARLTGQALDTLLPAPAPVPMPRRPPPDRAPAPAHPAQAPTVRPVRPRRPGPGGSRDRAARST
jgi:hypothetical protein